ncbi:hypothetical protein [Streptomyces sp. NPDC052036]
MHIGADKYLADYAFQGSDRPYVYLLVDPSLEAGIAEQLTTQPADG